MTRQFKVGDIVDATSLINEVIEKPINKIGRLYIMVDFIWFRPDEITLVQPFARKPYKDQFAKWKPGHLVTIGAEAINKLSDLEIAARVIANGAIKRMMEQQT